ncbi:hypothetical protein FPOAC2_06310 [Fusarium poae]|jgi:hypothetical protein
MGPFIAMLCQEKRVVNVIMFREVSFTYKVSRFRDPWSDSGLKEGAVESRSACTDISTLTFSTSKEGLLSSHMFKAFVDKNQGSGDKHAVSLSSGLYCIDCVEITR